ncbi:MAG: hypothetical protein OEM49_07660 [Myxococcales bacterium]|nr:hypothetical protein [Myxococcales bacterium]MDH5306350.1 hypothetical protein [Myxococcales bacterium]MDH5565147.1 hypothetical protein [Myxococcales bacterium]
MFGLPLTTTLLVFGFPLAWVIYTAVFFYRSRSWPRDETDAD